MENEELAEVFAERLKEARTFRGMNYEHLSLKSGVAVSTIWNCENVRVKRLPSMSTVVYLADALEVPVEWLLGRG